MNTTKCVIVIGIGYCNQPEKSLHTNFYTFAEIVRRELKALEACKRLFDRIALAT